MIKLHYSDENSALAHLLVILPSETEEGKM